MESTVTLHNDKADTDSDPLIELLDRLNGLTDEFGSSTDELTNGLLCMIRMVYDSWSNREPYSRELHDLMHERSSIECPLTDAIE